MLAFFQPVLAPPLVFLNSTLAPSRFFLPGPASINHVQKHAFWFSRKRHNTLSSCRSPRNGSHTPRSVCNACIASKFSRRQACGRMVVSTAKVCLCISTMNPRSHAMNVTIEMGFFRLSGGSQISDHHCSLKEPDTMKICNSTRLFLDAHPKILVSLVLSTAPTATVFGKPK